MAFEFGSHKGHRLSHTAEITSRLDWGEAMAQLTQMTQDLAVAQRYLFLAPWAFHRSTRNVEACFPHKSSDKQGHMEVSCGFF